MLSYLRSELPRVVHARPLVSVDVGRDRYSVGYSVPSLALCVAVSDGDLPKRPPCDSKGQTGRHAGPVPWSGVASVTD
jgi:hypothetical protein